MEKPKHVLVVPYPAQGHVAPLMKLSHCIAAYGVKVTFVSTEPIHAKLMAARLEPDENRSSIEFVCIPDGLETEEDRRDPLKFSKTRKTFMPGQIQHLIEKIKQENADEKISCVIADGVAGWALEAAAKMGIEAVVAWPAGVASLALLLHIPKMIEDGVIDQNGIPLVNDDISISEGILPWKISEILWGSPDLQRQNRVFDLAISIIRDIKHADKILCNTFYELEPSACDMIPGVLPIGPLLANIRTSYCPGSLCPEDLTCLNWLDKMPIKSVIYAAFGSTTVFSQEQLDELTNCLLELGQPFVLVVRLNLIGESLDGFIDGLLKSVGNQGKIVQWAPQERVLAHSSIACFISHCGWNSTVEGLSYGVPFLCWPYFTDQFQNRNYICDVWKIGMPLVPDNNGIITKQELRSKILKVLSDNNIRENCQRLKGMAMKSITNGGSSLRNLEAFVAKIKN